MYEQEAVRLRRKQKKVEDARFLVETTRAQAEENIRAAQAQVEERLAERNAAIIEASAAGMSNRKIAKAIGVTPPMIGHIVTPKTK